MDYDDYSYADNGYDEESYGYDSYDDADDAYDFYDPDDDDSIVIKPYDWDIYDSDDDVEYHESYDDVEFTHQVVTKSPGKSNTNNTGGSSIPPSRSTKPSSELAFNRVITHLFHQDTSEPIATFFIKTFGRRHIDDMIHPDLFKSHLCNSHLNQSEKDLLSILFICNRNFINFYGSPINEDWSNVRAEHFDHIGEEYGFIPINRDVTYKLTLERYKLAFQHIMNELLWQEMNGPIPLSLL